MPLGKPYFLPILVHLNKVKLWFLHRWQKNSFVNNLMASDGGLHFKKRKTNLFSSGSKSFLGHSVKELEVDNDAVTSLIKQDCFTRSSKNSKGIAQPTIKITNPNARLRMRKSEYMGFSLSNCI
uniref:Uncharacterized protein n=1 Tax=Chelonoidis abingdonii TaxID=106734 RepID=A0A8C0GE85_CHEAB